MVDHMQLGLFEDLGNLLHGPEFGFSLRIEEGQAFVGESLVIHEHFKIRFVIEAPS
jgi:hypothetical protein